MYKTAFGKRFSLVFSLLFLTPLLRGERVGITCPISECLCSPWCIAGTFSLAQVTLFLQRWQRFSVCKQALPQKSGQVKTSKKVRIRSKEPPEIALYPCRNYSGALRHSVSEQLGSRSLITQFPTSSLGKAVLCPTVEAAWAALPVAYRTSSGATAEAVGAGASRRVCLGWAAGGGCGFWVVIGWLWQGSRQSLGTVSSCFASALMWKGKEWVSQLWVDVTELLIYSLLITLWQSFTCLRQQIGAEDCCQGYYAMVCYFNEGLNEIISTSGNKEMTCHKALVKLSNMPEPTDLRDPVQDSSFPFPPDLSQIGWPEALYQCVGDGLLMLSPSFKYWS